MERDIDQRRPASKVNQSINQFIVSNFSNTAILPADKLQYYTILLASHEVLGRKEWDVFFDPLLSTFLELSLLTDFYQTVRKLIIEFASPIKIASSGD